jgi:hypothetical protein
MGILRDVETSKPIEFSTIGVHGIPIGTLSNKEGEFFLDLPDQFLDSLIVIRCMGYESKTIHSAILKMDSIVLLNPNMIMLEDVIVSAISPTEYIKRAIRKLKENLHSDPFQTRSYYLQKLSENREFITMEEGLFKSHFQDYRDTSTYQHQLLTYRKVDDVKDISFLAMRRERKQKKIEKRAERKNEDYEPPIQGDGIRKFFGGPQKIFEMDLVTESRMCLDSTLFDKFNYSFAHVTSDGDNELLIIDFETKNLLKHQRQKGRIYINQETDAIALLEISGEVVMPIVIRPFLFLAGYSIQNLTFEKRIEYQSIDSRLFPKRFHRLVEVDMKKRHLFGDNEISHFFLDQFLNVYAVDTKDAKDIPEEYRFNPELPMVGQEHNEESATWVDAKMK